MEGREEIAVRLTALDSGTALPALFSRYCMGPWAGDACRLYQNKQVQNDWVVEIDWDRVVNLEEMRAQRVWLVWAMEDLGPLHCTLWQEVGVWLGTEAGD